MATRSPAKPEQPSGIRSPPGPVPSAATTSSPRAPSRSSSSPCCASSPRSCGGPRTAASPTRRRRPPRPGRHSAPGTGTPATPPTWPRQRCRNCSAQPPPPPTGRRSTPPPEHHRRSSDPPAEIAKSIFGLTLPINTASDFVLAPVSQLVAPSNPVVAAAIRIYKAAGGDLARRARRRYRLGPAGNLAQQLRQGPRQAERAVHPHVGHGPPGRLRAGPGDHQG